MADSPLYSGRGSRKSVGHFRIQNLRHRIDNVYVLYGDEYGLPQVLIPFDMCRNADFMDDCCHLPLQGRSKIPRLLLGVRRLLTRNESFRVLQEVDYIKNPKPSGYRSLHLIVEVPIVISEGTLHLPVEIQLRTIAMDMWASLEHELRYKSSRAFSEADANRLRVCSEAVYEVDREMQNIYNGRLAEYEESEPDSPAEP